MKLLVFCLLFIGAGVSANKREKRQTGYAFPGPRSDRGGGGAYDRQAAAGYSPQQSPASYVDEQDDSEPYQAPRRQFQAQPVQQQYAPAQPRVAAPAPAAYEPEPRAPAPAPRQAYSAPAAQPRKKASASTNRANKYGGSAPQQALNGADEEEEEQLPDALTLLLQDSKFACSGKNDGYYADDSVNCQVFHYCVGGARHSWMCPDGTVFHQVHLNCVPDSQDICAQSPKFHFVNDYLYKPIDYQGPNNTARYAQRYYPDGYVVGDPIVAPQGQAQAQGRPQQQPAYNSQPPAQTYAAPAPAPVARPPSRQVAPPPPPPPSTYNPPAQAPAYNPAPAPARAPRPPPRPARPSYQQEAPQGYRGSPASQAPAGPPPSQQVSYQPAPQDNLYQPAPPSRRQPPSSSQSQSYSHSRQQHQPQQQQQQQQQQQYRPSSNRGSPQQYSNYGSNQAAGVQYDEDY